MNLMDVLEFIRSDTHRSRTQLGAVLCGH